MPQRLENIGAAEVAYRVYEIGEDNRVVNSTPVLAESDDEAVAQVREMAPGRFLELWDRGRLIVRLLPEI